MTEVQRARFTGTRKVREVHPAAELFPMMDRADLDALARDISENGLNHPVVITPDNVLLDGRNRLEACKTMGMEIQYEVYDGDPWRFVISENLHRRHLTNNQRAMVGARIAQLGHGGTRKVKSSSDNLTNGAGQADSEEERKDIPTRAVVSELLNVPKMGIDRGHVVLKHGVPELVTATESDKVTVTTAARIARMEPEAQRAFVDKVTNGEDPIKVAREIGAPSDHIVRVKVESATPSHVPTKIPPAKKERKSRPAPVTKPVPEPEPEVVTPTKQDYQKLIYTFNGLSMSITKFPKLPPRGVTPDELREWVKACRAFSTNVVRFRKFLESQLEGIESEQSP